MTMYVYKTKNNILKLKKKSNHLYVQLHCVAKVYFLLYNPSVLYLHQIQNRRPHVALCCASESTIASRLSAIVPDIMSNKQLLIYVQTWFETFCFQELSTNNIFFSLAPLKKKIFLCPKLMTMHFLYLNVIRNVHKIGSNQNILTFLAMHK